jgi:hypothetical protein
MTDYTHILYFPDILNYISNYLCYIDVQCLSIACPTIRKYINPKYYNINNIIFNRLSILLGNINATKLLENIHDTRVISGSFILQCIYNTFWSTDIDIYQYDEQYFSLNIPIIYNNNNRLIKHKNGYNVIYNLNPDPIMISNSDMFRLLLSKKLKLDYLDDYYNRSRYPMFPAEIDTYHNDKMSIDFIKVYNDNSYNNIYKFIHENFDISICKVIYDGNKLHILNFNELATKSGIVKYVDNDTNTIDKTNERIKKYEQRGFKLKIES